MIDYDLEMGECDPAGVKRLAGMTEEYLRRCEHEACPTCGPQIDNLCDRVRELQSEADRLREALKTYPRLPQEVFIGKDKPADKVVWLIRRLLMFEKGGG